MPGDRATTSIALNAAGTTAIGSLVVALNAETGVPSEIMLLPPGNALPTVDGRGPWKIGDRRRLIEASINASHDRILIDENHATDLAMPRGDPAPARGWVTALNMRDDGSLWGAVDWTDTGRAQVASREYRFLSPVLELAADGKTVTRILRASLINRPNIRGMSALNAEDTSMLKSILTALALPEDADEQTALNAIAQLKSTTALNAALAPIAKAAGLAENSDAATIATAVSTLAAGKGDASAIIALQAELKTVTTELNTLKSDRSQDRAIAFVDAAIKEGRVGVKPLRDHYIKRHALNAESAAAVETEINAMPILGRTSASVVPPAKDKDGKIALNAEQLDACKKLGIAPDVYAKTLAAEAAEREAA